MTRILGYKSTWFITILILSFISVIIGVHNFTLAGFLTGNGPDSTVLLISRVPRLISVIITGASLSIAGVIMQALTKNKFVSPSTAGTMEWCRFGVMLAIVVFSSATDTTKILIAIVSSFGGTMLFMYILNKIKLKDNGMIPLIGMMLGSIVSSITTFFAYRYNVMQNISSWLLGSFSLVVKGRYEILYIGIPFSIIAYLYADKFTISGMGEDIAKGLGINHQAVVFIGITIVAVITSTTVVTIGMIPFVGIIVPNIVSMYKGDNIKGSIFETAMAGAIFLLICDILSRVIIFPYEVSVSVIISVLGSGIFLILLFNRRKNG